MNASQIRVRMAGPVWMEHTASRVCVQEIKLEHDVKVSVVFIKSEVLNALF